MPTKKEIIFGHHFTSIAGTGPIVGPAIAIIWGWVPAMLWIFIGSIVMGAVHDFGALIISMRNQGKSISEYTAKYVNDRTKFLFFLIVFLELWIVIAIFGLVIAIIFSMYPASVAAVWLQIESVSVGRGKINELRSEGTTVLFSTHIMDQAEKLCDSVVLINSGTKVLDGTLDEVKRSAIAEEAVVIEECLANAREALTAGDRDRALAEVRRGLIIKPSDRKLTRKHFKLAFRDRIIPHC